MTRQKESVAIDEDVWPAVAESPGEAKRESVTIDEDGWPAVEE